MSTASRRSKWHPTPPPPPSPKILHFPRSRRTRRKQNKPAAHHHRRNNPLLLMHQKYLSYKGKLETMFDQENNESPTSHELPLELLKVSPVERRERVEGLDEEDYNGGGGGGFEEEKWRFQAEILRAECNLLRMEREFALKKLEKNRVKMERTLRSAVQTLVSGRKKIFEGKNVNLVLEEEIEDLAEKLEELQKSSRIKDSEVGNCSNFDKKACLLQRGLEKLGGLSDESCAKNLQELAESSLSINKESSIPKCKTENISIDNAEMDVLRKKMEGLSKGILDGVQEEYNSIVSISTANSSVASSASTSKRIECPEFCTRQLYQEAMPPENKCSGRCKAIIHRIVEQVRAETEQWSQMQEMLGQVRGEMEELQASRDYWESRAFNSESETQSLKHAVEEWKEKALDCESKANEHQLQLSILKEKMQNSKVDLPLGAQLVHERLALKRNWHADEKAGCYNKLENDISLEGTPNKDSPPPPLSLGKQLAKEKRMLLRRFRENRHAAGCKQELISEEDGRRKPYSDKIGVAAALKRSPLREIVNSSSPTLLRRNRRAASDFHIAESSRIRESFRK